jgi:hypothetical protein
MQGDALTDALRSRVSVIDQSQINSHQNNFGLLIDPSILELIKLQNATIVALRERLVVAEKMLRLRESPVPSTALLRANDEIKTLEAEIRSFQITQAAVADATMLLSQSRPMLPGDELKATTPSLANTTLLPRMLRTAFDEDCESRFGLGLSDRWRARQQVWCAPPRADPQASSIHWYCHHPPLPCLLGRFCDSPFLHSPFVQLHGQC